jgi:putative two-component system response regulator
MARMEAQRIHGPAPTTPTGARILVVDEDAQVRYLLRYLLTHDGYQVEDAASGPEALDRVESAAPDVVLLDLGLSQRTAHDVVESLRDDPRTRFVPIVMITGGGTRREKLEAIHAGITDFLTKPFDGEELLARIRTLVRLKRFTDVFEEAREVIIALASTIDQRDPYTAGHSERVSYYAEMLGQEAGLTAEEREIVHFGGLFHDIGKIAVRDAVLLKPGKLTPEERLEIQRHPVAGRELLKNMRTLEPAMPIVYHHHERYDGSGYPEGLVGERIPLLARVASIADVYDALTTKRPYRDALTRAHALDVMREEAGKGWHDPALFDLFLGIIASRPEGFLPGGEEA